MKRFSFMVVMLCLAATLRAQDTSSTVIIHKDPRLDSLIQKQIEINEVTTRHSRRFSPGYRILVISSNDRNKVTEAKTTIYRSFPELKAYMLYQAPFFRLKVGNFPSREEAEVYLADIRRVFEGNVYIVPDTIEIRPDLDDN